MNYAHQEDELLIHISRRDLEQANCQRIQQLLQLDLDWNYILYEAQRHKIEGLLYWHLKKMNLSEIPDDIARRLERNFQETAHFNLRVTAILIQILRVLQDNRIQAIPIKGPVLAEAIYRSSALRRFIDLDILVHKQDVRAAQSLLVEQGYKVLDRQTHRYDIKLIEPHGTCLIELHWTFDHTDIPLFFDHKLMWHNVEPQEFHNISILVPSAEHMLLYLCSHGYKHKWERLAWICDISELVKSSPHMNWAYLLERSNKLGSQRILLLGVDLAKSLLACPLPELLIEAISREHVIDELKSLLVPNPFSASDMHSNTKPRLGELETHVIYYKIRHRFSDKMRYLSFLFRRKAKPTSEDVSSFQLSPHLRFLYYLIRPIRLIKVYGSTLMRLLRS